MISPFDYVKSINTGKNIMRGTDNDSLMERDYNAFIVNRNYSLFADTVYLANEMNIRPNIDNRLQYEFLLNTLRPRKRFADWVKNESSEDVSVIKEYYGYSNKKAIEALSVLSEEQIDSIRNKVQKGDQHGSNKLKGDG